MGVLDGLKNFLGSINEVSPQTGLSKAERFGRFGASLRDIGDDGQRADGYGQLAAGRLAAARSEQQRQEINTLASQLNLTPRERLVFMANPQKWAEANASRFGAANLGGGETRIYGDPADGGSTFTAPKFGVESGFAYTQTPDSFAVTGQRPKSYSEMTDEASLAERIASRLMSNDLERERIGISRGQLGVSQGQLGLSREKFNWSKRGGGAVNSLGASLPSSWKVNP